MNYELAKELKEAGFPQAAGRGFFVARQDAGQDNPPRRLEMQGVGSETAYAPILEELIEACGENFRGLFNRKYEDQGPKWIAEYHTNVPSQFRSGEGSTPTEAVARLFIALNKKDI